MKLHEEFKLFENMWEDNTVEEPVQEPLKEARSVAEIKADIRALMAELRDVERAERAAMSSPAASAPVAPVIVKPTTVWTWDIYLTPRKKGTWTGIDNDIVFETKEKALDGAWELLNELDDEGELRGDPDDYTIDAFEIPISKVSPATLRFSNLTHLI